MFLVVFLHSAADTLSQETFYFQIKSEPEETIKSPINAGVERSSEADKGGAVGKSSACFSLGQPRTALLLKITKQSIAVVQKSLFSVE